MGWGGWSGNGGKGLGPGEGLQREGLGEPEMLFPHNQLLKSSPSTKPGFQAASSKQLSRVSSPPLVLLSLRAAPRAPSSPVYVVWRHKIGRAHV